LVNLSIVAIKLVPGWEYLWAKRTLIRLSFFFWQFLIFIFFLDVIFLILLFNVNLFFLLIFRWQRFTLFLTIDIWFIDLYLCLGDRSFFSAERLGIDVWTFVWSFVFNDIHQWISLFIFKISNKYLYWSYQIGLHT
jgi:hypothetical protein